MNRQNQYRAPWMNQLSHPQLPEPENAHRLLQAVPEPAGDDEHDEDKF